MKLIQRFSAAVRRYPAVAGLILFALGTTVYFSFFQKTVSPQNTLTVIRGDITEEVIVTGNTKPVRSIDLAFQTSGRIAAAGARVGDTVTAGEMLAALETSRLRAELQQAQAGVEAAQAKLESLQKGARPEDIRIAETAQDKTVQDLANKYNGIPATLNDAYAKMNDSVQNQLNALFINADTSNPQLSFSVSNSQLQINIQSERIRVGGELAVWKNELLALNASAANSENTLDEMIQKASAHLAPMLPLLNDIMDALSSSPTLGSATLTAYKTSVASAGSEIAAAITNVNTAGQAIASQKIAVKQSQDQLALQRAGSTSEDIRAQEAAVAQAEANTVVVQAQLAQTVIRSPIAGIITRADAKVGQIASQNATVLSVISTGDLKIDSNVPEVDIGKIDVGDTVDITLDAFPGETFAGAVVQIDPAETVIDGVVNFKITIHFGAADPRFKSGLTANLHIRTEKKTGVLVLPEVAILQNDSGTFVQKYENGAIAKIPVTLGARDQSGNVEIVSGVAEGDVVENIGLKTGQ